MKYLPLIWHNMFRRRLRTVVTVLSVTIAFLLFGFLTAIRSGLEGGVEVAGVDRLIMVDRVAIINPLPLSYRNRIVATKGVSAVTHATWFGGYYQDKRNFFAQFPVEPESYLEMYPEVVLPQAQRAAWLADRGGAVIGRALADRFGWKVGDRIPIITPIWSRRDGQAAWDFTIRGIFDAGKEGFDTTNMLFHYEYLNEGRAFGNGLVGWYIIQIDDPDQVATMSAALDALFANSSSETKTSSEATFLQGFADQVGDIGAIFTAIVAVVFLTLLLISGNTMAQSVRERTSDLAVMATLGFSRWRIASLVVIEAMLISLIGGGLGLGLAWLAVTVGGDPTSGYLPAFFIAPQYMVLGVGLVVLLGLFSGVLPAWQAVRLRDVDALRRTV
ncbi:MAG: FtsX-like permease family protein [Pseudomonadota bacterium]